MKKQQIFLASLLVGAGISWATVSVATNPRVISAPFLQFSPGLRASFADAGNAKDIEALKKRVVRIFEKHIELGNINPKKQFEIGSGQDGPALDNLKRTLQSIDAPLLAEENLNLIVGLYKDNEGQSLDLTFDTARFIVDQWQGISISGNEAKMQFIGGIEIQKGPVKMPGSKSQWLVTLIRDSTDGPWLMSSRKGIRIGG